MLILTRGRPVSAFDGVPCLNIIEPDVSDLKALFEEDPTRILYANFTIKGNGMHVHLLLNVKHQSPDDANQSTILGTGRRLLFTVKWH